jgi:protein TonB
VTGRVVVQAVIGDDGRVHSARILKGIPLLDGAAVRAVCRWRYQPAHVDGKPVPVHFTTSINFALQ